MAEIIYQFSREKAQNAVHVQYARLLLREVPEEIATKYGFTSQRSLLATAVGNEETGFKPDRGFFDTEKVLATDAARDSVYLLYRHIVRAFAEYALDEARKEAGKLLNFAFNEAGDNVQRLSYDAETAILVDLVEKFRTEEYAAALATLGLENAPDEIEAANDEFQTIYRQRMRTEREKAIATDMKLLRAATDDAFDNLAKAVNALYAVNELVTKDETTRKELGELIDNVNDVVYRFRKVIGSSGTASGSDTGGDEPTPEPVTPEITSVYNVSGGDPEKPLLFDRYSTVGMTYQGFTLKGQDGTLEHVIGLVEEYDRFTEWIKPEAITNVTDTGCQFAMVEDLAGGKFKVRVETYDGGSPLVVEYPELITLD